MENSYLFLDKSHQRKIGKNKLPIGVKKTSFDYQENTQLIIKFTVDGENERSADKLSIVHDNIIKYSPRVITCDSSAYYNQKLYQLANQFERKLRQLIYLATSSITDEEATKKVTNLELQTLGVLFDNLFTDTEFINKVKNRVNGQGEFKGMARYSKAQVKEHIELIEENSFWKLLFGNESKSIIAENYYGIWESRNSIMHAHNIGKKEYKKSKELIEQAVSELDERIEILMKKAKKSQDAVLVIEKALLSFTDNDELLAQRMLDKIVESFSKNLERTLICDYLKFNKEYKQQMDAAMEEAQNLISKIPIQKEIGMPTYPVEKKEKEDDTEDEK